MKCILFSILLVLILNVQVSSQNALALKGKVVNVKGNPVSFASVALYSVADSLMCKRVMSDDNGGFVISGLKNGNYYLQVFFVGFKKVKIDSIRIIEKNVNLHPIVLVRNSTQLEEVNVVSEKGMFESQAGKMVYNVEGNINAVGESALELIQNIPSLGTDMDDKVTLRGAKATVLVDDIESDLSSMLDQIPADAIESIEVITNPSARYESKSGAGIVNIKLIKSAKTGYNGKIGVGIGTHDKQNLSALFGYNLKKWKFSSSVNYQKNKLEEDILTEREMLTNGQKKFMTQVREDNKTPVSVFLRNSVNYYFDEKSFLSFQYVLQDKSQKNSSQYLTEQFNSVHKLIYKNTTGIVGKDHNLFNQFSSDFQKIFKGNDQHSLNLNLLFSFNTPLNEYDQLIQPISVALGLPVNKYTTDDKNYSNSIHLLKFKADYGRPVWQKWKIELGGLFSIDHYLQDLYSARSTFEYNSGSNKFEELSKKIIDASFDYYGYGASSYGLISGGFKRFRLSAGLRFELTINETKTDNTITNRYYIFIPSFHLKHVTGKSFSWELSYTSRILPPNSRQLNPISLSWGEYFKSSGNPKLDPEVFSQAELASHWMSGKSNYNLTFFAKNRSGIIEKWYFIEQDDEGRDVTISIFENLGGIFSTGFDANAMLASGKFIFRPAISTYYSKISGDKFGPELDRDEISVTAKLSNDYKLKKDLVIQFSGQYNSPFISEVGKMFGYYTFDAGIKANVFKNKATVSLKVVDIFDTMNYDMIVNQRINYTSTSHVDPHRFLIYVDLSYKFNSIRKKN